VNQLIYRVDRFKVPAEARAEFLDRVEKTHHILRALPGFIQDAVLEQTGGPGQFNFVTIAIWYSQQAIDGARAAVIAGHQQAGLRPQEMFSRLGIEADIGTYQEVQP
jgi:heme-degrading monooxygenase HmoA